MVWDGYDFQTAFAWVMFGSWKVLGKEKNIEENNFFMFVIIMENMKESKK